MTAPARIPAEPENEDSITTETDARTSSIEYSNSFLLREGLFLGRKLAFSRPVRSVCNAVAAVAVTINANIQEKAASSAYRTQKTLTTTVRIPEMPAAITKNNLPGSILKTTSIETVNPAQEEIKEEYS